MYGCLVVSAASDEEPRISRKRPTTPVVTGDVTPAHAPQRLPSCRSATFRLPMMEVFDALNPC